MRTIGLISLGTLSWDSIHVKAVTLLLSILQCDATQLLKATEMSNELDLSLLDMDLEEIADLPGFAVPPNGEYILKMTCETKEVNKRKALETSFEVVECLKQDDDTEPAGKIGDKFSMLFFLENDDPEKLKITFGKLKELVAGVAESTGISNVGLLVRDVLASTVVQATVKRRVDKDDKDKIYATVKNLRLA